MRKSLVKVRLQILLLYFIDIIQYIPIRCIINITGSLKLGINGRKLCCLDGTEIDDDEVLTVIKEPILILCEGEEFKGETTIKGSI